MAFTKYSTGQNKLKNILEQELFLDIFVQF